MSADPAFAVLVGARWLHFASLFALFGGSAFWLMAGRGAAGLSRSRQATVSGLRIAGPFAVVSGLAWLDASLAGMTGGFARTFDPEFLRLFFLETPFGPVALARLGLFAGLLVAVARPCPFAPTAWVSGALLVSQAWLGHAADAGPNAAAMVAAYAVHVLAGAIWLGGLPVLLLAMAEEGGLAPLTRFSGIATAAALVAAGSGAANTAFHAGGSVAGLAASGYGRVLAIKLALVAAMLALAAVTRFVSMPRLRRGEPARPSRAVALELCAGAAVLAAAAVLGITAPPR